LPEPSVRNQRLALAGVLLVAAVLMLRPVLGAPFSTALGSIYSEAPRHLWALWGTVAHFWEWGPFVAHIDADFPSGYTRHLMDPVNLVFFVPGYLLSGGGARGAACGYNLVHVSWTLLAGLGGWLLCRRLLASHTERAWAALLAAAACATAPYLMATPYLGRTELLPGAAWALHLWWLHRALTPRKRPLRRDVVGAGLSLAAIALGGWYLAGWLMLLEPPVALAFAWAGLRQNRNLTWRSQALRLLATALLAALPLLPALWALFAHPPPILGEEQRLTVHMGINTPPWLLLPFLHKQGLPGVELPAYPGLVLCGLALWGCLHHPRRALPWTALGGVMLLLSLGPYLVWSNEALAPTADPPRLPAWYLEKLLPPLRFIWGWCRIGILVSAPLALAAAWGVAELLQRYRPLRPQLLLVILGLLVADQARVRAPAGVLGSAFEPQPPAALLDALRQFPPGAILQLPLDDFYIVWQLGLGRPVAESMEIEDVKQQSYIVQRALDLLGPELPKLPTGPMPGSNAEVEARLVAMLAEPELAPCMAADGLRLGQQGFAAIVLHRDRLPDAHRALTQLLAAGLGRAAVEERNLAIWTADGQPLPAGVDCPLREVQAVVVGE